MERPVAGSSRHADVHVLSKNIEQLVVDCLDEGQYQVALTLLSQVLGPTVVPSSDVLRQVFVLASCKPDRTADHGEFARPRRKRKRRGELVDTLPEGVPPQAVASALALLHQYTPHPGFAEALLSALTAEVREVNGRGLRARRSQSGDTEEDEREADPLTSGVRLLIEGGGGSVWELLRILDAQSKGNKGEWSWQLPSSTSRKKKRGKEAARSSKPTASSASAQTCWDALQRSAEDQWASMDLDLDNIDEWRDALERFKGYQSERCWRLIDLFVSAWHTQGRASKLSGTPKGQQRRQKVRSDLEELHLVQQLRTRGSRLPLDDAGEALDIIFAGLCNLEAWAEQPRRLSISQQSRLRRAEVAARLFLELVQLSRIGALESSVLVRGVQERLVFASASNWAAFTGVVQRDEHAASILADAHLQMLETADEQGGIKELCHYDFMLFPSQKELVFRALQEGIASHRIIHLADSRLVATFTDLHAAQRLDLLLEAQHEAQALKELSSIRAEAAKALTPSEVLPARAPTEGAPSSASAFLGSHQAPTIETNGSGDSGGSETLRKSGRTVKAPIRTGLRKLPTHGMSRGKPPFRKERGDFSSSSASVSPSKDQAELRASIDRQRDEGVAEHDGSGSGSGSRVDMDAWLFTLATEELHALDGALNARNAIAAVATAVEKEQ